jgi:predicted HicB family RNase H-like nuclease
VPQQDEPQPQTSEKPEERVNFTSRVRASVRKRARLYAAQNDLSLQDLVDTALDDYLTRHNA